MLQKIEKDIERLDREMAELFARRMELVKDQPTEIAEMIIDYIDTHKSVVVDKTKWLKVLY